jgi:hypothetical protein
MRSSPADRTSSLRFYRCRRRNRSVAVGRGLPAAIGELAHIGGDDVTAEDIEALDMLTELAGDPDLQLNMNFIPGDIQFLHNHTILHAGSAYEDWPEAERKRHLLRLWLSPPGARPLPPVFAECYGGITIGDRGGIVCKGTRLHVPLTPG